MTGHGLAPFKLAVTSEPLRAVFSLDLQSSLVPEIATGSGTPTFTRATTKYVLGYAAGAVIADGPTLILCASGEAGFTGARRVSEGVWSKYDANGVLLTTGNGASASCCDASGPFGYNAEGARTNRCLQSSVFENAAWTKSNVTAADNSAVAPDGTSTAATLTATAGNGTVIQDLGTVASAAKAGGLWIKRKTGSGNIDLTLDGGSTWTTRTVTAGWTLIEKTQTLADEDFGVRIVTDTDAVYVWTGQVETAAFLSSPIPTTTVAVARNVDTLSYVATGNIVGTVGSCYAEGNIAAQTPGVNQVLVNCGTSSRYPLFVDNGNGKIAVYDGVSVVDGPVSAVVVGSLFKGAANWGGVSMSAYLNGAAGAAGVFDGGMDADALTIGNSGSVNSPLFGTVRNVRIYGSKLSDAALQAMTS